MNKYSNSIVYKITNNLYNETYYGSTIQTLKDRIKEHKRHFNRFLDDKTNWCQSYQIIMDGNYKVEKVEDFPCNSLRELLQREDYYILNYDNINQNRSHNTPEERKAIRAIVDKIRHDKNGSEKNDKYKKHLKAVNERGNQIVNCPNCDKSIRYDSIYRHKKTKYCLTYNTQN